ncbi:MAG TPA: inorganic phosphate transporter [Methanoregula sp.]|nr:inorganic phosphate transporter [Methanoregula sp.]
MIEAPLALIFAIIAIALIFDFTNGFHDSANSISTVVSTKVLSPRNAVVFAAFFNFAAAFGFGVAVANTISKIVEVKIVGAAVIPYIVLGALIGAITWNLITWFFGLPTSSSHALIGGLTGAGISAAGLTAITWPTVGQVALFMFLSPLIGLACGFLFMAFILNVTKKANKQTAEGHFKRLQLCSAAAYSFSHGTNDAQKTIGIIIPLLFSIGYFGAAADPNHLFVPIWVILLSYATIALGTLSGGWRIVKTMGYKITKLRPVHGFAAETAGAATILGASAAGIPVSTTHVICTSIMGVGSTMGTSTVKWGVARSILFAWILTIPISALIGFFSFMVIRVIIGY